MTRNAQNSALLGYHRNLPSQKFNLTQHTQPSDRGVSPVEGRFFLNRQGGKSDEKA